MSRQQRRSGPGRGVAATQPGRRRRTLRWTLGVAGFVTLIGIGIWLSTASNTTNSVATANSAATGDRARGESLFSANCARCHGPEGTGTQSGPPLVHEYYVPSHHAEPAFLLAVRTGVRPHHWNFGAMPPIGGLTDADVTDIVTYVRDLQRNAGLITDGS